MKQTLTLAFGGALIVLAALALISFDGDAPSEQYDYMQVSTIESVVPGGVGRSRIIYTESNGSQQEEKLENLYSMVGLNLSDVKKNDADIVGMMNELAEDGWGLEHVVTGMQSPSKDYGYGIFITRYIFRKAK